VACFKAVPQHSLDERNTRVDNLCLRYVKFFLQWNAVQCTCVLEGKFHDAKTFYLIILFFPTVLVVFHYPG